MFAKKNLLFVILYLALATSNAQTTAILTGSNFRERSDALIYQTSITTFNASTIDSRTGFVYCAARYVRNVDLAYADAQLNILLDRSISGDDYMSFSTFAVMHTYLLCKDKLSVTLKNKIKVYLQSKDYNFNDGGTYNLTLMPHAAAYLACEEWPDFNDATSRSTVQIKQFSKNILDSYLNDAFRKNYLEVDAPTYYPTNIAPFRMLANFVKDEDLQRRAFTTFQMCVAHMNGSYNKGLYVANPARSKGWGNLGDGLMNASGINSYAWLLFGKNTDKFHYQRFAESKGFEVFNFWLAYPGYAQPSPTIFQANAAKTYPYYKKGYRFKRTYQSTNYGMATWDTPSGDPNSNYNWKETKRHYLAWQYDQATCHFTICQDNPLRPTDPTIPNGFGNGDNPYHRIMQHNGIAIGIWNVPTSYFFYKLYIPYQTTSYKGLLEKHGWIICHTGTMMFALKTIEPYIMDISDTSYKIARVDNRKGGWVMETTELTAQWGTGTITEQMNNYADILNTYTTITPINYTTANPQLEYTALDGSVLNITYFDPNVAYTNQFKINGVAETSYSKINDDITAYQDYDDYNILIKANGAVLETITYGQNAQNSILLSSVSTSGACTFATQNASEKYYWIFPEGTQFLNNTNPFSATPQVQFSTNSLSQTQFCVYVFTDRGRNLKYILGSKSIIAEKGMIRFNTDNFEFEGFDGVDWRVLGGRNNILDKLSTSAAVGYSLRKMRANYTGAAIRVRRTDNLEQDIGFTSSGDLDTTALQKFVGSGNGFVKTWYDQSGNAKHATQTTAVRQAKIVNAGNIILLNGKPALETSVAGQAYSVNLTFSGVTSLTVSFVGARTGNLAAGINSFILGTGPIGGSGTVNKFLLAASRWENFEVFGQSSLATTISTTESYGKNTITAFRHTNSNTGISYTNSLASAETATGFLASTYDATQLTILGYGSANSNRNFIGLSQEIIVFMTDIGIVNLDILTKNQSNLYKVVLYN